MNLALIAPARRVVVTLVVLVGVAASLTPAAGAEGERRPTMAARWLLTDDEPQVLTGYADDANFDVELPAGWQVVGDAHFRTDVVATEIARDDLSLRVDVDGRPLDTWSLTDRQHVDLILAPELFDDGGFRLTAETTAPIVADSECLDPSHVGRWVDIGVPTIGASIAPTDLDVARAVAGFGPVSALTGRPVTLSIHGPVDEQVIEIMGTMAAAIGQHGAPFRWNVVSGGSARSELEVAIIPVAGAPTEASVSVDGATALLTLTGDPDGLVAMATAMAHPDRLLYFHSTHVSGDSVPPVELPSQREVFGFADAGYDDRTLRGVGEKALIYRLHIPAGVPPDRATLALYGTYSPLLADANATFSVRINGSEEEIVAVADESGRLEVLHTITPANLRPGLNYVKVSVDMGNASAGCHAAAPEGWITISRNSALAVELEDSPQAPTIGVEDARFALATALDFSQADVALVDDFTPEELRQALTVIGELADRAEGGAPRLVVDGRVSLDRHLVVVGAADDRPLLTGLIPVELNDSVGLVGAIPSPHRDGRVMLAFTGGNVLSTNLAIDAALSHRVNDVTSSFALVSLDRVEAVGDTVLSVNLTPEQLAYSERQAGPEADDYEAWLLAQAARIESAAAPQAEVRRAIAFGLLLLASALFGLAWIRKVRLGNQAGHG